MKNRTFIIKPTKNKKQWELHQQLSKWAKSLNRLQEGNGIKKDTLKPVPISMLPMIL
jgi:hypothetical protein